MNTDHFIALYDMENYIWTMIMASWTPLIIHDSYELQTSMISDHSKWGFIRFTRSMITHDCYEHWLWAITVHRNSYEFGFWTINDQTHHTWWGGINAMKCWCSYMINTDSVSYYDPFLCISFFIFFLFCIFVFLCITKTNMITIYAPLHCIPVEILLKDTQQYKDKDKYKHKYRFYFKFLDWFTM